MAPKKKSYPLSKDEIKRLDLARDRAEWLGEILAVAGLLANLLLLLSVYGDLPAQIVTHFDAAGIPNGWGSKSTLWFLFALSAGIYAAMTLFHNKPQFYNTPVTLTRENVQRQLRLVRWLLLSMKIIVTWLMFYLSYATVRIAQGQSETIGILVWVFVALLLLSTIPYFILAYKWK